LCPAPQGAAAPSNRDPKSICYSREKWSFAELAAPSFKFVWQITAEEFEQWKKARKLGIHVIE
jgi:hypothetical protein